MQTRSKKRAPSVEVMTEQDSTSKRTRRSDAPPRFSVATLRVINEIQASVMEVLIFHFYYSLILNVNLHVFSGYYCDFLLILHDVHDLNNFGQFLLKEITKTVEKYLKLAII
jgi:hypothetical protein